MSLVVPNKAGWYEIAEPISDAVQREFQSCSREEYKQVADALERYLEASTDELDYLALKRVQYRALVLAGHNTRKAFALVADWIQVSERLYHSRGYEQALKFARAGVEVRPSNTDVRMILIKSLIKLGDYAEAQDHIVALSRLGQVRDAHYVRGFLERHRGNLTVVSGFLRVTRR